MADDMLRVEELEAVLPSMTRWRVPGGRGVDWAVLEAGLGTALPSDFRLLAEAYPVLVIDDFLSVSVPRPGGEAWWASESREDEILQDLYEMGDTEDYVPFPQPGGLISWAESDSGDCFYWRTSPADPDAWPVVVRGDNGDRSKFPVGAIEFLTGVYRRTLHVPGMPRDFPSDSPEVLGLSDRID
ncbi:SMI1/KNR4 family protein [Streptomyces viridosporus]|uniref:SMI1/KNR4 family protein n=1 Tax=Streptomyces viridosporus TaxID=67581 RepID=UPI00210019DE|nr:SMI1/KNR4 family protein [Streptomyces viridosporus]